MSDRKQTTRRRDKPSFREFVAPPERGPHGLDRASFRCLGIEEAVDRILTYYRARNDIRETTATQKHRILSIVLRDLAERDLQLATLQPEEMTAYRSYLADLVSKGKIDEDYAAHIVVQWNSVMNQVFGQKGLQVGDSLKMKGFRQTPREIERLTDEDFDAILRAADEKPFQNEHYRHAFKVYVEIARATGARVGSIRSARGGDIDWEKGTITFPHMKNKDEHTALLTPRALVQLRKWIQYLEESPLWRREKTPILVGPKGTVISVQTIDRQLRAAAAFAGVRKKVSTHRIRKSVGTAIAQVDPDFAARQLGISLKILQRHYNMPSLEDLMAKRELLEGARGFAPKAPEELAGWATLEHMRGRLTEEELREHLERAKKLAVQPRRKSYEPEVA